MLLMNRTARRFTSIIGKYQNSPFAREPSAKRGEIAFFFMSYPRWHRYVLARSSPLGGISETISTFSFHSFSFIRFGSFVRPFRDHWADLIRMLQIIADARGKYRAKNRICRSQKQGNTLHRRIHPVQSPTTQERKLSTKTKLLFISLLLPLRWAACTVREGNEYQVEN